MRPIALDTNARSAFRRGDQDVLDVLGNADEMLLGTVVLWELLAGFGLGSQDAPIRAELTQFLQSPRLQIVPVQLSTADIYANLVGLIRRRGWPIPTNDVWIAAGALENGAALLTLDAHFTDIDGLRAGADPGRVSALRSLRDCSSDRS